MSVGGEDTSAEVDGNEDGGRDWEDGDRDRDRDGGWSWEEENRIRNRNNPVATPPVVVVQPEHVADEHVVVELALLDASLDEFRRLAREQAAASPAAINEIRKYIDNAISVFKQADNRRKRASST